MKVEPDDHGIKRMIRETQKGVAATLGSASVKQARQSEMVWHTDDIIYDPLVARILHTRLLSHARNSQSRSLLVRRQSPLQPALRAPSRALV